MTNDRLVYRGAKEICAAVGINHKQMLHYVKKEGLPAFKLGGNSKIWIALPEDLEKWIHEQRDKYLKK